MRNCKPQALGMPWNIKTIAVLMVTTALWMMPWRLCRSQPQATTGNSVATIGALPSQRLAEQILGNRDLTAVLRKAKGIVKTGFNAGDGYGEVWIRDLTTFMELSCEVNEAAAIKQHLLMFFRFQGDDGHIIDGFIPKQNANVSYRYVRKPHLPDFLGHKNTVETDQESSLIQAVYKYVQATGDRAILNESVDGQTVAARMERSLQFLLQKRFSKKYGLLWGATTADWGDVQPEHEWGVVLDANSHRAIDVYDNAMFLIAIENLISLQPQASASWKALHQETAANCRTHLWDANRQQFIPHIYLDGSPFPDDFDERALYYHGGTAVAIQAGLLSKDEIAVSLTRMRANVKRAGASSIGLTIYPPYPDGFFLNPSMGAYSYQNGGDWTWFGGRLVQTLIRNGFVDEAYREILPMVQRVLAHDGFYEWYTRDNQPRGSGTFRGSAGVLGKAIQMLQDWAEAHH